MNQANLCSRPICQNKTKVAGNACQEYWPVTTIEDFKVLPPWHLLGNRTAAPSQCTPSSPQTTQPPTLKVEGRRTTSQDFLPPGLISIIGLYSSINHDTTSLEAADGCRPRRRVSGAIVAQRTVRHGGLFDSRCEW